mmetsp:Transcript_107060/g.169214  ORF Transcript_107060/g.169214 Transcript_107060/m.169214 type:complete len:92 (-) Transcript_107060:171-446(-)
MDLMSPIKASAEKLASIWNLVSLRSQSPSKDDFSLTWSINVPQTVKSNVRVYAIQVALEVRKVQRTTVVFIKFLKSVIAICDKGGRDSRAN